MEKQKCYKCGKEKISSISKGETGVVEMTMITYGKHKGGFKCKDCKQ